MKYHIGAEDNDAKDTVNYSYIMCWRVWGE